MTPQRRKLVANLLLLGVAAIWGSTFALVKDALHDAPPLVFNLLRMVIASAALLFLNRTALRRLSPANLRAGAVAGVLLATGYQLQTAGLARTSAVNSALITGLIVVLVPCLSILPALRAPRVPPPRWPVALGALLAFAGLILMTTPPGTTPETLFGSLRLGDLLTLGCALAFAAHLLALAHFADQPAAVLATLQIVACTALMTLTLPLGGAVTLHLTARLIMALLITGLLATAVAFTVQSWAQQHLSAGNVALLLTMEPVFALLVSATLLGERLTSRSLAGAGFILGGIVVTEFVGARPIVVPEPI